MPKFAHEMRDFTDLCRFIAGEKNIPEQLVEKDYWIMHCLWGLQQQGFDFHLKGGTSLSKGWGLLERFSEDIDIYIFPEGDLPIGRNQNRPAHIEKRREYFEALMGKIKIDGIVEVIRDPVFDDRSGKMRGVGISLKYKPHFEEVDGVKPGVLLEVGFDQTTPNEPRDISSWVMETLSGDQSIEVLNNRAQGVRCYLPEYTFVEKLQTVSTKYRLERASGALQKNQLRHYYDLDCLLKEERVQRFIGTGKYKEHKIERFRRDDESNLTKNEAFLLSEEAVRQKYSSEFASISNLFYGVIPSFEEILKNINPWLAKL